MKAKHHQKTALDNIFDKLASEQQKARIGPNHHLRQQKKAIKEIEEKRRKQREEEESDKPQPFKMKKFKNVDSIVQRAIDKDELQSVRCAYTLAGVPHSPVHPISGSRLSQAGLQALSKRQAEKLLLEESKLLKIYYKEFYPDKTKEREEEVSRIISSNEGAHDSRKRAAKSHAHIKSSVLSPEMVERNYIRENRARVVEPRSGSEVKSNAAEIEYLQYMVGDKKHKSYGKVPQYLAKKREIEQEEHLGRNREKPPPGTRLLSQEEKLAALYDMEEKKKDLTAYLGRFPIANRPLWIQKKEKELLDQLEDVEHQIRQFQHERVYVRIDYEQDTS